MAARKKRNSSSPSTKTSSEASNPRKPMQAKTAASSVCFSSSSFHKGKRGRPKKLVIATRGNGDLKSSIIKSPSGTTDSTFTTTKKFANPEIPNSKNEKLEIASAAIAGEVALKDTAIPQQSSTPAAINEGALGDSSSDGIQPPSPPNLKGKKSPRKGKPNRAPFS
ncbi:hypothetical protein IEQ34_013144 [Dendrobium chrysotoxum]|uniref:Uncharacterized protein n=1 Tax=Dendrobium chrysotoxum TaxID=161865 RepID=A0AAV7G7K8_DENCH|nr:hypothetical protein IEQ34_013144 [Dendrobium chrysotoxum]